LNEINEEACREKILEGKQDAVCYLYDTTDADSFAFVADLHEVRIHPATLFGRCLDE